MNDLTKYSFANAKIRAMLSFLIPAEQFKTLLDAKDIYDVLDILKNTSYKEIADKLERQDLKLEDLEKHLQAQDIRVYKKVSEIIKTSNERNFVELLMQRYEIDELKTVLRIWHKKIAVDLNDYIFEKKISFDIDFKKIISCQNIEEVILLLDETPYKQPLLKAKDKFKEHNSSFYLESALDIDYYQRLIVFTNKLSLVDRKVALRILGIEIDIENINSLIKLRKYYSLGVAEMMDLVISGGEHINRDSVRKFYATDGLAKIVEGIAFGPYVKVKDLVDENIYFIENFLYEILLHQVKRALAGFPFTIGTVLGYLILKRRETKSITSLFYSKALGLKKEEASNLLGR